MKKFLALLLALSMVLSLAACGGNNKPVETQAPAVEGEEPVVSANNGTYTYHSYSSSLGTNWNPHTWEMSGDSDIMAYIETPFVDMTIKDSATGEYQWIFLAATDIIDVTAEHQDDLEKYGVMLTEGKTYADLTEGYVYEIKLNPEMRWANGEQINADTYIYSMQQLLNPEMKNYRANNYYSGESAIAGAKAYFWQGSTAWTDAASAIRVADLVLGEDGTYATAEGAPVVFNMTAALTWLGGNSMADYVGAYGDAMFDVASFDALVALADEEGNIAVTDETIALLTNVITFSADWGETAENVAEYLLYGETFPEASFDTVGLYKVDDYTIRYVCNDYYDYYYFLTSCTSNWIVYEDLYEAGKDTTGTLVTTNYGTSVETTMAYGAYKIESLQDGKQIVFVQNPEYFEYDVAEDGTITSTSSFLVDGENVAQFQTQKIVIDVMTDDAAKQAFMKGELDSWTPSADEVVNYTTSTQLYQVDETYTMRLFFNCALENLQKMDESYGNTNSVVLSNENFRKALSLAIDRDEFVTATAGYKAAYSMLSYLYFYDVYEDPASIYRNTDEAMQAICNLYGVEYGEGTAYATLADAFNSINGYNLTEAKNLLTTACAELVEAGLYTEGAPVVIRMGWMKGAMGSSDQQQVTLLNEYINAAAEGTGFGTITLEGIDNLPDRYASVANGEFAIGWGAWGGAAFYPFTMFRVYCDPDYTSIHEIGSWNPATTDLTLTIDGEEVTMTWQQWSNSMTGSGKYANASNETKLAVLAGMEENYMELYYCIPICTTTACYLLSYKLNYYTEDYSIMYGFGGTRLMTYNYSDAEWTDYVASQGGTLSYE